jgi:hypothetical protein
LENFVKTRWALILIFILASLGAAYAQDSTPSPLATTPTPSTQSKVPDGNGAWALDLFTSGGFDGMGVGTFSVNSSGQLTCSSTKHACPAKLTPAVLSSLTDKVKAAAATPWDVRPAEHNLCSDCIMVRLQLSMRQPDGSIRTFVTSWDTTSGVVPEHFATIYKTLTAFGK